MIFKNMFHVEQKKNRTKNNMFHVEQKKTARLKSSSFIKKIINALLTSFSLLHIQQLMELLIE